MAYYSIFCKYMFNSENLCHEFLNKQLSLAYWRHDSKAGDFERKELLIFIVSLSENSYEFKVNKTFTVKLSTQSTLWLLCIQLYNQH